MNLDKREIKSRKLSYLLRQDNDYKLESGGWRLVSDLILRHSFTVTEIDEIVSTDSKGRFQLSEDKTKVRALYGHSVNIDLVLAPEEPPESLYHGTASKYLSSIKQSGLIAKARQYVHLTEDIDMAIKTGRRHGKSVLLKILTHKMDADGYVFYHLSNGVWLTDEVPLQYIDFKY